MHPHASADSLTDFPPERPVFEVGQVLDNTYRIVRLIGEGGMGLVYEATHARLAGRYAIKVIVQGLSDNPEAAARFDREARITSCLQHPNIVQVIDFNRLADGTEYLVMEYLQGEALAERLSRVGALPFESVANIVDQIAAALAAAHAHGIVHRDLKPDNVFLLPVQGSAAELVKVLDFGISKVNDTTQAFRGPQSGLMGTPKYMAPEQCRGQGAAMNGASDQFALAVIAFEMLTGFSPFAGDSIGSVLARVLYENPPPMGVDPSIQKVVRRGLAKTPEDRFPSVVALAQALRAAIDDHLIAVAPDGGPPRRPLPGHAARSQVITEEALEIPRRRGPWLAVGLASAAILAAAGSTTSLGRRMLGLPLSIGLVTDVALPTQVPEGPTLLPQTAEADDVGVHRSPARPIAQRIIPVEARAGAQPARRPTPPEKAAAARAPLSNTRYPQPVVVSAPPWMPTRPAAPPARPDVTLDRDEVLPLSFDQTH